MKFKISKFRFYFLLLVPSTIASCKYASNSDEKNVIFKEKIKLTDSNRTQLTTAVDSLITHNLTEEDTVVEAEYLNQGETENAEAFLRVKIKNDSILTLTNPMPLKEGEILRLKKDTNNIMVGFGKYDKIVKFIAIQYQ